MSRTRLDDTYYLPNRLPIPDDFPLEPECPTPYTIKGTTFQVIVNIAEIHLTPEKPSYPGGSWHIEGTDAEKIVATGLYYFACENITESKLSFRVIVQEPEYEQGDDLGMAAMYGLEHEELLMQLLGAATAVKERCLVFPNTLQHKVEPFELVDKSKPGVRKILTFFLVDPNKKIQSTSVIPPQQKEWLEDLLSSLDDATNLPVDAVKEPLMESLVEGMTREEAVDYREELKEARRAFNKGMEVSEELSFSLCEH